MAEFTREELDAFVEMDSERCALAGLSILGSGDLKRAVLEEAYDASINLLEDLQVSRLVFGTSFRVEADLEMVGLVNTIPTKDELREIMDADAGRVANALDVIRTADDPTESANREVYDATISLLEDRQAGLHLYKQDPRPDDERRDYKVVLGVFGRKLGYSRERVQEDLQKLGLAA